MELTNAAKSTGNRLKGIILRENEPLPKAPAIVYLSDRKAGHFVVVNPVEGSDSLIQVIDAPSPTRIVNADFLRSDAHWTGRLLVMQSSDFNRISQIIFALILISILATKFGFSRP